MNDLHHAELAISLFRRNDSQASGDNNTSPGAQSVSALLGAVLGIALLFVCSMILAVYLNRRACKKGDDHGDKNSVERLKKLEAVSSTRKLGEWWPTVKESLGLSQGCDNFVCVICFDQVERTHEIHELKCLHVFHKQCLERWYLRSHYTCPMCHQAFFQERRRSTSDFIWMV